MHSKLSGVVVTGYHHQLTCLVSKYYCGIARYAATGPVAATIAQSMHYVTGDLSWPYLSLADLYMQSLKKVETGEPQVYR